MRTKALICAAAFAAFAISAMADNVYSLNVVGYVNVALPGNNNSTIVNNVLNNANNHLTNLFPAALMKDGCTIFKWSPVDADFDPNFSTFSTFLNSWDQDWVINVGDAVFFTNPDANDTAITLTGDVSQNNVYTRLLAGNSQANLIGSSVPLAGSYKNSILEFPVNDGDTVFVWDNTIQDWNSTFATYSTFLSAWDNDFDIGVGNGFLYGNNGPDPTTWNRHFTVNP